jgi:4-diphosphocytidyl-2-C-methyl-D-erythritol kinase
MLIFPNCKINLGLQITGQRTDGFHNIETIFYPLPLCDALEIVAAPSNDFTFTGEAIPGNVNDNLCVKAFQLLKTDFPALPAIHLHLHKIIPLGAGLGGGSADAAFTLLLLNDKFQLQLTQQQLADYASVLGSDCAFFIYNTACQGSGKGEILNPVSLNLSGYSFVLVYPRISVNTAWAYSQIKPTDPKKSINEIIQEPIDKWKNDLVNDFEEPVFESFPIIGEIKRQFYEQGALYAAMTGSGSTVFGIFPKNKIAGLSFKAGYQIFLIP